MHNFEAPNSSSQLVNNPSSSSPTNPFHILSQSLDSNTHVSFPPPHPVSSAKMIAHQGGSVTLSFVKPIFGGLLVFHLRKRGVVVLWLKRMHEVVGFEPSLGRQCSPKDGSDLSLWQFHRVAKACIGQCPIKVN